MSGKVQVQDVNLGDLNWGLHKLHLTHDFLPRFKIDNWERAMLSLSHMKL